MLNERSGLSAYRSFVKGKSNVTNHDMDITAATSEKSFNENCSSHIMRGTPSGMKRNNSKSRHQP